MSLRTLTVNVTSDMYDALARRASHSRSTVADELVRAAQRDVAPDEQLPVELEGELAALTSADEESLRSTAASSRLSDQDRQRLEELHHQKSSRGLSQAEEDEAQNLLAQYDR